MMVGGDSILIFFFLLFAPRVSKHPILHPKCPEKVSTFKNKNSDVKEASLYGKNYKMP